MKRILLFFALLFLGVTAMMAQMRVWSNNRIIFEYDYTKIDSITFALMGDPQNPNPEPTVENGMYVIGEATGYISLDSEGAAACQMAIGYNEASKSLREGMYEKYIILEGGKEFKFIEKNGDKITQYTAALEPKSIATDGVDLGGGFAGAVSAGTIAMKVENTGLYHIVLDLNRDRQLDAAGGAQVVIAPVGWLIRGGTNGWGTTLPDEVSKEWNSWTWKAQKMVAGTEFRFAYGPFWKINLDVAEQVIAEVSLGKDMIRGGENIVVDNSGVYDITLNYNMAKGEIQNSFSYELNKVDDYILDPATFVVGISGSMNGWNDPFGYTLAKLNEEETQVMDITTKAGTYVYNMSAVTFEENAEFKFRVNGNWLGYEDVTEVTGVTFVNKAGNIGGVEGTFDIELVIEWEENKMTALKTTFNKGIPMEPINITAIVPTNWERCYLYAWTGQEYFFPGWPGKELAIQDGKAYYEFKNVDVPIYAIFSNGDGVQTKDIIITSHEMEIDIATFIKEEEPTDPDYSNVELELVGTAVATRQANVYEDTSSWRWGQVYPLGKPEKNPSQTGTIYTWTIDNVNLWGQDDNHEFKVRTKNGEASGGIAAFDIGDSKNASGNLAVAEYGVYSVTVTINATTGEKKVNVVKLPLVDVTIKAKAPSDWTNTLTAWIWTSQYRIETEMTKVGEWWVYSTSEPVTEINVLFKNGTEWENGQTIDVEDIRENTCFVIGEADDADATGKRNVEIVECDR